MHAKSASKKAKAEPVVEIAEPVAEVEEPRVFDPWARAEERFKAKKAAEAEKAAEAKKAAEPEPAVEGKKGGMYPEMDLSQVDPEIVARAQARAEAEAAEAESTSEPATGSWEMSSAAPVNPQLRILIIGPASVTGESLRVVPFEQAYRKQIEGVCAAANVRSISMVEYAKGWAALSAAVDDAGWPEGVGAIQISRGGRYEIIEVLSRMASIVVEA